MSDIFREVEEDVRRERFVRLWKQYGDYFVVAAALVILAIAGFELWQRYETSERAKASAAFIAAQNINDPVAAEAAFAKIAGSAPGGYQLLAELEQANFLLAQGKAAPAIALYKTVAADSGPLGDTARLRAAWALADTTGKADLQTLLAPLSNGANPWAQMAREVLAYADYRAGNIPIAQSEFDSLANDPLAPDALRHRALAMTAFLKAGAGANYGTVPPPPPPASQATAPDDATVPAGTKGAAKP